MRRGANGLFASYLHCVCVFELLMYW